MPTKCYCIAQTTNLQCKKFALKNSIFCEIHKNCLYSVRGTSEKISQLHSFIVKKIGEKLDQMIKAKDKGSKISLSIQVYDLVVSREGLALLAAKPKFKKTVINKLVELIESYDLKQFIPYYEKITNRKYIRSGGT